MSNLWPLSLSNFAFGPETLALALAAPLLCLLACAFPRLRNLGPVYLIVAPLFALAASVVASDAAPLILDQMIYPMVLVLDAEGALLLGVTALLWTAAGIFVADTMRKEAQSGAFAGFWLATLAGNIGVFMAADVASFYLFFALVSLPAYGLIVTREDDAGGLYVAVALLGEAFLILAFVLLASGAADHSLLISDGVAALNASEWRDATIGLLVAGFGTKIGLLPLHIWMPSTYRSAPAPAAAVLSGGAVNAGVIGLLRFLPSDHAFPMWGELLGVIGMSAAFYGVAIGVTQRNPKTVLAYSSVSQMGLVAATVGMSLGVGKAAAGAALYAAHHGLAKGGLFLATIVLSGCGPLQMRFLAPIAGLLALSLAGLPWTGGALAKYAIKEPLGEGVMGHLSTVSSITTTMLMLHFMRRVVASSEPRASGPGWKSLVAWLAVIAASILVPAAYLAESQTLDLGKFIWDSLWPILIGALLTVVAAPWFDRLPSLPEGDVGILLRRLRRPAAVASNLAARGESVFLIWPFAASALLFIALVVSGTGLLKLY